METTKKIFEDFQKTYWNKTKEVLLKLWKTRIRTAKQRIKKSKKILSWNWTFRWILIEKPTNQSIIDLYNERIKKSKKIIDMWEIKIQELNNF